MDTIGLIAPSGFLLKDQIDNGINLLRSLGFQIRLKEEIFNQYRFFAGHAEERAQILQEILIDDEVDCLLAVRGGSGAIQILPYLMELNFKPSQYKPLIGFSDFTTILNFFTQQYQWITWHSHNLSTLLQANRTEQQFWADSLHNLLNNIPPIINSTNIQVLCEGTAQGKLIGGNLTVIMSLLDTPWELDPTNAILLIEDINEYPYEIERFLVQLKYSGFLEKLNGILLGDFSLQGELLKQETLQAIFLDYLKPLFIPVLYNIPSGHYNLNDFFPIGAQIEISTNPVDIKYHLPICF